MTGPDPRDPSRTWTRNDVGANHGTSVQAGQVRGDLHVGATHDTRRVTTISLPAAGVVIGAVLTLAIVLVVWKVVAPAKETTAAVPTSGAHSPVPTGTTTGTTSAPVRAPRANEVRLPRKTGADIDGDNITTGRADGATGAFDVYLSEINLLYANGSNITEDHGPENQAEERCRDAVSAGGGAPAVLPGVAGTQYCLATSDDRIAWLRVTASTLSSFDTTASVVLAVHTWPA